MIALLEDSVEPERPALLELVVDDRPAGPTPADDRDHADWTAGRVGDALERRGTAHVLQEVRGVVPYDAAARKQTARFGARFGQRIARLALVGEPAALRRRASTLEPLIGGELRCFPETERETARTWLKAA